MPPPPFVAAADAPDAVILHLLDETNFSAWREGQGEALRRWIDGNGFRATAGSFCLLPEADGRVRQALYGVDPQEGGWMLGAAATTLPPGDYAIDPADRARLGGERLALGWGLGGYRFERYRTAPRAPARLRLDSGIGGEQTTAMVAAIGLVRDLINTPADAMMPHDLAAVAASLAEEFGGTFHELVGDSLLDDYPCLHAVGRASIHSPRLLDLRWGDEAAPKLTLVGKGICFDSGGLDIKPSKGMRQMKKDMGGAAHVLGLARLVMALRLPVRLRVLVAAAENAIAGNAFRPGDVLRARNGLTIEVDNTDAEGRLAICDALTEACAESPDLLIDFATLTGAARVAVGTEIAAYFSNDERLVGELNEVAALCDDPVWRLPLHRGYRYELDSQIADLLNCGSSGYAGATTAALFLHEFIEPKDLPWLHFDVMAWNLRQRPGRPIGGEAMGLRAVWAVLKMKYPS